MSDGSRLVYTVCQSDDILSGPFNRPLLFTKGIQEIKQRFTSRKHIDNIT